MTDEERQRAMDFIAEQTAMISMRAQQPDVQETEARCQLNRDMDRLERVLKRVEAPDPKVRERRREEDKRWEEFARRSRERSAEISALRARSDQKLKSLIDDVRNKPESRS